jgi:hypothetical protein
MFPRHDEEFSDHSRSFSDVFLDQFRTGNTDESTVGMMRHRTREQGLPRSRRTIQQHTLGLCDTQTLEQFRMLDRQLDDFLDFLDLAIETADHFVCRVGNFLDHHEGDEGVDLVG